MLSIWKFLQARLAIFAGFFSIVGWIIFPHNKMRGELSEKVTNAKVYYEARILDNSSKELPYQQIAIVRQGNYQALVSPLSKNFTSFPPLNQFLVLLPSSVVGS